MPAKTKPNHLAASKTVFLFEKITNGGRTPEERYTEFLKALRLVKVPKLTDGMSELPSVCIVRFHLPGSAWERYVAAWNRRDECWGLGVVHERGRGRIADWTFFSLWEIAQIKSRHSGLGVMVDTFFQPLDGWRLR
jgi:hypothetical protein